MQNRYLIGIDLGTTNIALSYYDLKKPNQPIQLFKIPQIVAPGQIAELTLLPAYYLYAKDALFKLSDVVMPWQKSKAIIGHLAKELASNYPNLSISSAKSYLSHPVMNIESPFLPLGSHEVDAKISPFEVIIHYLDYLKGAWNHQYPNDLLENQVVVITIPASFNDQARQSTLKAATSTGFKHVKLLEEPIAAFYHWLNTHNLADEQIDQTVSELALVLDIGGGTSDFSLIQLQLSPNGPSLNRIATGKHLLVGGDNMDCFLLQQLIKQTQQSLKRHYQNQWLNQIQQAKETLFSQIHTDHNTQSINISFNFKKSKLIAKTESVLLDQSHLEQLLDGFFPKVSLEGLTPQKTTTGLRQFGLAFESNPQITAHIADFLYQNQKEARDALNIKDNHSIPIPQVILFNGGIFHCQLFTQRITEIIDSWREVKSEPTEVLYNDEPSLAVAYGACSYLKAKHEKSLTIQAGSRSNYFIQVSDKMGLCILTKGTPEGHINQITKHPLKLQSNQLLRFPLFLNDQNTYDIETLTEIDDQFNYVGSVITELKSQSSNHCATLSSELNEAGILSLMIYDQNNKAHPLEFNLTNQAYQSQILPKAKNDDETKFNETKIAAIKQQLETFFSDKTIGIATIKQRLNHISGDIHQWPIHFAREIWDILFEIRYLRFKRPEAEQYFYYLTGLLLNPGFGEYKDNQRIEKAYELYDKGIEYVKHNACISSFWVMWRRLAPGLSAKMQTSLYQKIKHALLTKHDYLSQKNLIALDEKIRLVSVLEKLPMHQRIELGNQLIKLISQKPLNSLYWWALGRIGNRQPISINPQELIPTDSIESWLEQLIPIAISVKKHKKHTKLIVHALILIARKLDDDYYQLDSIYEQKLIHLFNKLKAEHNQVELIKSVNQLDIDTSRYLYGNDLPLGLTL
ncbi:MAG: hypothetical protein EP298_12320 [Gammaproteobacteria bacterium]|nr:MAG: hypothetical protein EP298_12320 [Gammaproteobacteria bacterium]UTW43080.1 Hsp70 family protein [bacterium SCSIO 12844]